MINPDTLPDLSGRIAVVTGANSGIGLWTTIGLARAGARLVMVCRDAKRGEEARAIIAQKGAQANPDLLIADFADLKAVNALGERICEQYPKLHILVNNAGLFMRERLLTKDGYETTFAVNHLAPFLLTNKVLPSLERAGREGAQHARIVTVASMAARGQVIDFDDLMFARGYSMYTAYGRSKLANILFTKELSRRLKGHPVTANCLHPGVVATRIGDKGGMTGLVWGFLKPVFMTPEKGAVNSLYVATAPEIENVSGAFFVKRKPATVNRLGDDADAAARLWNESEKLVNAALMKA
jgi:NAD(P)-dependent dehydrogenase (short-subunit alcohol dehydrogenase family)